MNNKKVYAVLSAAAIGTIFSVAINTSVKADTRDFTNIKTQKVYKAADWRADDALFDELVDELTNNPDDYVVEFTGNQYIYDGLLNALINNVPFEDALQDPSLIYTPETTALEVSSVSAINAREIQITFNQAVDEDSALDLNNYVISKNDSKYSDKDTASYSGALTGGLLQAAPNDVTFNETTNTVTFRLATPLANADKYSVDVRDGVLTSDKSIKLTKYTDTQKTFTDVSAPKLVKSELTSTNYLKLTFDEPVAAGATATVDGVAVGLAVPSTAIKTYTVLSAAPLDSILRTAGTHAVSVYNAADLVTPTANSVTILTGSFSVATDTTAPYVQKIVPVSNDDRSFDIVFSEPLKSLDTTKLVVKKGNYTFEQTAGGAANHGSTTYFVQYAPLNDDGTTGALGGFGIGTSQVVRVTFGADDAVNTVINPLYATTENSVDLAVETDNYKDTVDLVGAKYNGSVTLTKDLVGPKVSSQYQNSITGSLDAVDHAGTITVDTDGLLVIKFDKTLSVTATDTDKSKITVTDKDGIPRTVTAAAVINDAYDNKVSLQLTGLLDRDDIEAKAPYTVSFAAGAVKATNNIANSALTTTVLPSNSIATPVAEAVTSTVVGAGNVITITYNTEMTASAASLANYTLDTVAFPTGTTISMNGTNKIVTITLPEGYTNTNITKLLTISKNVVTKAGSAVVGSVATKASYTSTLAFTDNTKPTITDAKYLVNTSDQTTTSKIKVVFSENLNTVANDATTIADLKVTVNGATQTVTAIADGTANDKVVTLTLLNAINVAQAATISVVPVGTDNAVMDIKDIALNTAKEGNAVTSTGTEIDVDEATANASAVATDKAATNITYAGVETNTAIKSNVTLVAPAANGSTITWTSTNSAVTNTGVVTRPIYSAGDATGNLTATITKGSSTDTKVFAVTVLKKDFVVAAQTVADDTFTITGDGYVAGDFAVTNIDMDSATVDAQDSITVNGLTYTVTYDNTTGIASVAVTGTATATEAGTTQTIAITKDGKTANLTLNIPAVTTGDLANTVIVTIN